MRAVTLKLVLALIATLFLANTAFALDYETAYMVKDNNSTALSLDSNGDYSYNINETPWIYIKFKLDQLATNSPLHMLWVWSSLADPNITESRSQILNITGLGADKEVWSSAPEPWWSNEKGPGNWIVDVNWFNVHGTNGVSSAAFNVTCGSGGGVITGRVGNGCGGPPAAPEPVSTTLFLLGGAPIVGRIIQQKFKKA